MIKSTLRNYPNFVDDKVKLFRPDLAKEALNYNSDKSSPNAVQNILFWRKQEWMMFSIRIEPENINTDSNKTLFQPEFSNVIFPQYVNRQFQKQTPIIFGISSWVKKASKQVGGKRINLRMEFVQNYSATTNEVTTDFRVNLHAQRRIFFLLWKNWNSAIIDLMWDIEGIPQYVNSIVWNYTKSQLWGPVYVDWIQRDSTTQKKGDRDEAFLPINPLHPFGPYFHYSNHWISKTKGNAPGTYPQINRAYFSASAIDLQPYYELTHYLSFP